MICYARSLSSEDLPPFLEGGYCDMLCKELMSFEDLTSISGGWMLLYVGACLRRTYLHFWRVDAVICYARSFSCLKVVYAMQGSNTYRFLLCRLIQLHFPTKFFSDIKLCVS